MNKLMFLGTASSVGKSTLAAAFCRYYRKKGLKVAPFKALNISLNSFVTKEGDEIGRAQVVQAEACRIEPKEYMNPILMKPSVNNKTQVIVRGKVYCTMDAYKYKDLNKYLRNVAKEAFQDISKDYEFIILEGSGSCAEINLRETDIANMEMAKVADAPVILVADIDRGGVFASIVGTIMLLPEDERARIKGIIINKFRGKREHFQSAIKQIEEIVNIPVLGVMPYFQLDIEDEDGVTERIKNQQKLGVDIAVIRLPHMSNFTDFNMLASLEGVNVRYIQHPSEINNAKIIVIPGSKNTINDLEFIRGSGFENIIIREANKGTVIFGICGGYQILGNNIKDIHGVEGSIQSVKGIGLLEIDTIFNEEKNTKQTVAKDNDGLVLAGYEIHNGESITSNNENIWLKDNDDKVVGMRNSSGNVYGTYLHGILDNKEFVKKLISSFAEINVFNYEDYKQEQYDKLCELLEENIDMSKVEEIIN